MINKIAFIGAGSMAEAIISGIVNKGFLQRENIFVTNRSNQERLEFLHERYQVQCTDNKKDVLDGANIIILSMKPYDIKSALNSIKEYIMPNQIILSVAAGITTGYILNILNKDVAVIRAMPNTSASIGYSATAITRGYNVTEKDIDTCVALFETIGTTTIIEEEDMHVVTGVSGSGPAYVYYLVEAMEKAAIESGLDSAVAKSLINQTIIGAGKMLEQSGESAETLRKNVTSPAGTTEAGINKLVEYDFEKAIMECVKSARNRSIELGEKL